MPQPCDLYPRNLSHLHCQQEVSGKRLHQHPPIIQLNIQAKEPTLIQRLPFTIRVAFRAQYMEFTQNQSSNESSHSANQVWFS